MFTYLCIFILVIIIFLGISLHHIRNELQILKIKNKIKYNDENYINTVNILGTHDSLTYSINNFFSPFGKTQIGDLQTQYNLGTRFFDLRFQKKNDKLIAHHGIINLNLNAKDVFDVFLEILKEDDAFIIISLRPENNSDKIDIKNDICKHFAEKNSEDSILFNTGTIPKIKAIRNKIYFINIIKDKDIYEFMSWSYNKSFTIYNLNIEDVNEASVPEKIDIVEKFMDGAKPEYINLVFLSIQTNFYTSIKFMSESVRNALYEKGLLKNKKGFIFIFDYINNIYSYDAKLIQHITL